jgi:F0F1-type ATP synthase beta subunit
LEYKLRCFRGVLVDLKDTIRSFKAIMNGEGDDLPEGAF